MHFVAMRHTCRKDGWSHAITVFGSSWFLGKRPSENCRHHGSTIAGGQEPLRYHPRRLQPIIARMPHWPDRLLQARFTLFGMAHVAPQLLRGHSSQLNVCHQ